MELVLIIALIVIALVMFKYLGWIVAVIFSVAAIATIMDKTGLTLGQMVTAGAVLSIAIYAVVARFKGVKSDEGESKYSTSELDKESNEQAWKR
ncbi:hypothetical protein NMS50_001637 [Vibrio cholerae]|nr:hypothetical protein [Vibrio cholerae]